MKAEPDNPINYPPIWKEEIQGISFRMILVEGGVFQMGGTDENKDSDEEPVHQVRVPSFYLGEYQVTQHLWEAIMGENPSNFKGPLRPVENVSWEEAKVFIHKLSTQTGREYRLPTESEWEFAARGGNQSEGYLYAGSDKMKEVGWYSENSENQTHPVGQKMENELELFDMSGNVYEWCEDGWHDDYEGAPNDGSAWIGAPKRASSRVIRGGGWGDSARDSRVSYRNGYLPDNRVGNLSFRLALVPQSVGREP